MNRTRIVRWLRVLLPLVALAILSTMFLFSGKPGTEPEIPYAEVDAQGAVEKPRVIRPDYAGVTSDGAELSFQAQQVVPGSGQDQGSADSVSLDWQRRDGLSAHLTAPTGGVDDQAVSLTGGVRMTTSTGWQIDSPRIDAATDRSVVSARDGITADGPLGQLDAGAMELSPQDGPAVLNFTGGVRLIYTPPSD
ncbi:hypothetical protein [Paracoccus homiensis]|uniref:Lipopolysaccharide export system protein LptC n=1 Tax=Paracoccus homiensis TaxID=364199 RepID=A0A1H9YND7_9RHOB|nr:hypothetical protein [Paracoccus homiensis]SES70644.1 lipopolysaccharide export system protein LptC [Paracoccus homiensis]